MAQSSPPSDSFSKDPVRIVYHAENRTFARLFNEHSLAQLKDVVRQKLGLGRDTDVSLKQMRPDALLDLDDDDDFQAFRVLLKSCVSADIQVTVGGSQGVPQSSVVGSSFREPIVPVGAESSVRPEGTNTAGSSAAKKTVDTPAQKRKVSLGTAAAVVADKPVEQSTSVIATSVTSAKAVETPAVKPADTEEPPKKRQKKDKTRDVQPSEDVSTKSRRGTSRKEHPAPTLQADGEPSDVPVKKPRKRKTDDTAVSKKSSAPDSDVTDKPVDQPTDAAPVQLAPKTSSRSKTRQNEKPLGACATVPRTAASASVQSEVMAAILSASTTLPPPPPPPPPKRKYVRKAATKPSTPSSNLPTNSTPVSDAPADEVLNVPANQRPEYVAPVNEPTQPPQGSRRCPICLGEPFHIRYRCPTVLQGPDAIRERLEEVRKANLSDQQSLIKELEGLLVTPESAPDVQSHEASQPSDATISRTTSVPNNSNSSKVTVESRDEESSTESSDDTSEHDNDLPAPGKQKVPDKQPLPSNDNLEAVMRGPALKRQSVLDILDRIVGDEDGAVSDSEEDVAELEEDPDEVIERSSTRLPRHIVRSSDSESEEEESGSSSSPPAKDALRPRVHGSNDLIDDSTEHQSDDVLMGDHADPPVFDGKDGGGSETRIRSEDRMVVDNPTGEKDSAAAVEEQLSPASRSSVLRPSNGLQVLEADPTFNGNNSGPMASQTHNEIEVDPIEPADGLVPSTTSRSSNSDPIEASPEETGSSSTGVTQSTPKPGVTRRIKTRSGQILDDEAERPVLLEQLALENMEVTPFPTKGKPRKKIAGISASQDPLPTRKSPRFNSLPPSTSTPVATALLNQKAKTGTRTSKATKTPARRPAQRTDTLQSGTKDIGAQNGTRIAPAPSLVGWETLAEPTPSPFPLADEPSLHTDELMSSSPQPGAVAEGPKRNERLFDPSPSQIPFPYSQYRGKPTPLAVPNGKGEETSDSEEGVNMTAKKATPSQYRSLSQLASQAVLFSALRTPASKPMTNGKAKKLAADKASSSSSSESENEDEDGVGGSQHIPRGRRAGTALEAKKRRKSLK